MLFLEFKNILSVLICWWIIRRLFWLGNEKIVFMRLWDVLWFFKYIFSWFMKNFNKCVIVVLGMFRFCCFLYCFVVFFMRLVSGKCKLFFKIRWMILSVVCFSVYGFFDFVGIFLRRKKLIRVLILFVIVMVVFVGVDGYVLFGLRGV